MLHRMRACERSPASCSNSRAGASSRRVASNVMAPSSSSGSTGAAICLRRPLASTRSSQSRRSRHATGAATPAIASAGEWPAIRSSIVAPCCQQEQPYSAGRVSQLLLHRVSPSVPMTEPAGTRLRPVARFYPVVPSFLPRVCLICPSLLCLSLVGLSLVCPNLRFPRRWTPGRTSASPALGTRRRDD